MYNQSGFWIDLSHFIRSWSMTLYEFFYAHFSQNRLFRVFLSLSSVTNIDKCKDVNWHIHKLASWASVYTDAPFRQIRPAARFAKPACWGHPQSPYDCQLRCQAERLF